MAHINLLPWREDRREEQQKQLLSITALSVILMLLIILAVHLEISRQINKQKSRNNFMQSQITAVNKQITEIGNLEKKKKSLVGRMKIIQRLQENRPEIVHLFDEIARRVPEGIYLTNFKQNKDQLIIKGIAQSNARVSAFMRNIDDSEWLGEPRLDVIKSSKAKQNLEHTSGREFVLYAKQVNKQAKNKGNNNNQPAQQQR